MPAQNTLRRHFFSTICDVAIESNLSASDGRILCIRHAEIPRHAPHRETSALLTREADSQLHINRLT